MFRRLMRRCLAVLICAGLPAAYAQVTTTVNYNLALSDGVLSNYHFDTGSPCNIHVVGSPTRFRTTTITVTAAGSYAFSDYIYLGGGNDGSLGIFTGAFDPANPATNCFAGVDDNATYTLPVGTYTLVLTALDGLTQIPGSFGYTITGLPQLQWVQLPSQPRCQPCLNGQWCFWRALPVCWVCVGCGAVRPDPERPAPGCDFSSRHSTKPAAQIKQALVRGWN